MIESKNCPQESSEQENFQFSASAFVWLVVRGNKRNYGAVSPITAQMI